MKERVRVQGLHAPALRDGDITLLFLVLILRPGRIELAHWTSKVFCFVLWSTGLVVLKPEKLWIKAQIYFQPSVKCVVIRWRTKISKALNL